LHLSGHLNRRKFKKVRKASKEGQRKITKGKKAYESTGKPLHVGRRTLARGQEDTRGQLDTYERAEGHLQRGGRTLA
jgi:hypothetical protein